MFESTIERPCSCCGKMTRHQEFVMIHAGKSRPALVAKCSSECGRDIGQYESQELSPILENHTAIKNWNVFRSISA